MSTNRDRGARQNIFLDAPLAPGQSKDPYVPKKLTKGDYVENVWSLWHAARKGDAERVTTLLDRDGSVNINKMDKVERRTPLHWACRAGRTRTVKLLLDRGASINVKDKHGNTPLHYCCGYGTEAMLRILLNEPKLNLMARNEHMQYAFEVRIHSFTRSRCYRLCGGCCNWIEV